MRLLRPEHSHLDSYCAALRRGWSPDNIRGAVAAEEQLAEIAADAAAFLALMDDPEGRGPPVVLADGSRRARIPSLRRWMWGDGADDFIGSIGLRWMKDHAPLLPHVLGHIGYTVVPWQRRQGHGTRALALMLELARAQGMPFVDITTDVDNIASQKVATANGAVLVERFDKGAVYGHQPGLRWRIELA